MKKGGLLSLIFLIPMLCFATTPPPPANEVFQLSTHWVDANTLSIEWDIKKGYFLYQQSIRITEPSGSNVHVGNIPLPVSSEQKMNQNTPVTIYRGHLSIPVAILGTQAGEALLTVHYQGCSDDGFCYPPESSNIRVVINPKLALIQAHLEPKTPPPPSMTQSNTLNVLFSDHHWIMIILSFFGFGVLLSLTPCVLPMVPVLSGIIVGHGHTLSTRKAFFLSLSYVLSMSITYAIAGAMVAIMGSNLQIAMQSPWIISLFSALFVLLSLSMFNLYELRLPISWQARLAQVTKSHSGGHYLGAALMGCLSTLILSPCVTAPLIGALGYIAQTGDVVLGSVSLFFLSLGMGTPLLLIGASAGRLLPKAGQWMNAVKSFFGVMLLAVAITLMSRIIPAVFIMALWASLLIFTGIYMGALTKAISHIDKFFQGSGIILLMYGLLILIGTSQGHHNPLQPLASEPSQMMPVISATTRTVTTLQEATEALEKAKGSPVMIDFYADWCATCKHMAETTLQAPKIRAKLNQLFLLIIDVTKNNTDSQALLTHFHVVAPPTFLFINKEGRELTESRLVGAIATDTLDHHLYQFLHLEQ